MTEFQPPIFRPHPIIRGGHLQTIVSLRSPVSTVLNPHTHIVPVSDGDAIVLHEDRPESWQRGDASMLLVHGLVGCHGAPYMLRLAESFLNAGMCVFRMDMRGCGAAADLAVNLTHAGRSDDILAALQAIDGITETGELNVIAVSMGANQLLRGFGRIGAGIDPTPPWFKRVAKIAAIAPPLDLQRCADNMERWALRPYNYYFIRALLARAPKRVRDRPEYRSRLAGGRPRTLRELDDRVTAPLCGFEHAADYYDQASAIHVTGQILPRTLVLTAADDPIVPVGCFVDDPNQWSANTELVIAKSGGHVGYIDRDRNSWMDQVLKAWFEIV